MVDTLTSICSDVLGTYNAASTNVRVSRDSLRQDLVNISNTGDALKIFKRAQRNNNCTFTSPDGRPVVQAAHEMLQETYHKNDNPVRPNGMAIPMICNFESISRVVFDYALDKSCGADGISQVILRLLSRDPVFISLLTSTFNIYFKLRMTPYSWNHSIIHLLPKNLDKRTNTCSVNDSRPISLTVILRRLFETLAYKKIVQSNEEWTKYHPCQGGFQEGRSVDGHVLLSHLAVTNKDKPCELQVFLDISKAFDRISHTYLLEMFVRRDVPLQWQELFYSLMMDNTSSTLIVNHMSTPVITRQRGLFQGSILSPMLFNFAIDELTKDIKPQLTPYPHLLLFADDIKIQCPGYDLPKTQDMLDKCDKWARKAGLEYGHKKCGAIGLRTGHRLLLSGKDVKAVGSYDYLGIPITHLGIDFRSFMFRQIDSAKAMVNFLLAQTKSGTRHDIKVNLVKIKCRGILQYGLGIFGTWSKMVTSKKKGYAEEKLLIKEIKSKLKEYHELELEYIFGFKIGKDIMCSMANLENIDCWLRKVNTLLALRLQGQKFGSPWFRLFQNHKNAYHYVDSKDTILAFIFNNTLVEESKAQHQVIPKVYIMDKLKKDWHQGNLKSSSLVSYISYHCRKNFKKDTILHLNDSKLRREAIFWRCNQYFVGKSSLLSCVCGETNCKRTHYNDCQTFKDYGVIPVKYWLKFGNYKSHRQGKRNEWKAVDPKLIYHDLDKITILDYLLNIKKYRIFKDCIDKIYKSTS